MLSTRSGVPAPPYALFDDDDVEPIDVYLVHRGPDSKDEIVRPLAYVLKCLGVKCFADTSTEEYSMPLGQNNEISMRRGLSACQYGVVILSETFCDSIHCVSETNTLLYREQREKRSIIIPAFYTSSIHDQQYRIFNQKSSLVRRDESAKGFALKIAIEILRLLKRPEPHRSLMRYYLTKYETSLEDLQEGDFPINVRLSSRQSSNLLLSSQHGLESLSPSNLLLSSQHGGLEPPLSTRSYSTLTSSVGVTWSRPLVIPSHFLRGAVGRLDELEYLHSVLCAEESGSSTIMGNCAILRGPPGMGKTVLAAMYADRRKADYPGGVLWLTLGPNKVTLDDSIPILQEMIKTTFPELMLQDGYSKIYSAEEVRNLLAFYPAHKAGKLRSESPVLIILDDVWSEDVLAGVKEALPLDFVVLMTTRDYHVAFSLADSDRGIITLDVLSQDDAVKLLRSKAKEISIETATMVAKGLGFHAQALTLAAGSLSCRRGEGYDEVAVQIVQRLSDGEGFGDLPRSGRLSRKTTVEKALDMSYEWLGGPDYSRSMQAKFRGLGVFAQEADFSTEAVASVWNVEYSEAHRTLIELDALALVQQAGTLPTSKSRWQQHAVIRAYEMSLWIETDNSSSLVLRHAAFYTELVRLAMAERPRNFDTISGDFRQIQHAFFETRKVWPDLSLQLVGLAAKFLIVRGHAKELERWLNSSLQISLVKEDVTNHANLLRLYGDVHLQMGNFDDADVRLDQALGLFKSAEDIVGQASTLHSMGDVQYRLGKLSASKELFLRALPLFRLAGDRWGEAVALRSLGDVERFLGNYEKSREYCLEALALFVRDNDVLGNAGVRLAMGRLDSRIGDWKGARKHFEPTLELYESMNNKLGKGSTLKCIGDLFLKERVLDQAKAMYEEALSLFTAMNDELGRAQTLRALGDVYFYLKDKDAAHEKIFQSLRLYEVLQNERGMANALRGLAAIEKVNGNNAAAQHLYSKAKDLFESVRATLCSNTWKHLDHVEYELQSLGGSSTIDSWSLIESMKQPYGNAQTLDILSEVER
jgi:tetratricopeptide (TPR) repeat protein